MTELASERMLAYYAKRSTCDVEGSKLTAELREYSRLRSILQRHAARAGDIDLVAQMAALQREVDRRTKILSDNIVELEGVDSKMREVVEQTEEDILKAIDHADKLAELHIRELEIHYEYIREQNKRLKSKMEALGIKTTKPNS